ncbi:hypothetical protein VTN77DRAFT_6046 [Rasamsonia byssochlamydoides]|uniref:uncharacterized protein n=1 Tax=Rasamsonia byssochlamydoides TaxID=89139 RepID=UPI00374361F9
MEAPYTLPSLPAKHKDFLNYVNSHPNTPMEELVKPYNDYDGVLRKIFAQQPSHPALADNHINIVPLYDVTEEGKATDVRIRARDLTSEPKELQEKYIMPLKDEDRKPNGAPAVVSTLKEFQTNFNIFCEGSLSDLDWSNVVAAGSSVVTSLLPVPDQYRGSKRGLRQFYHEIFAPASDVDLFLYGLTEEQAIEKVKQIEAKIKDSVLAETTTIRTKNAITIASKYPTRHVQIVLRIYKSIAEILTGFDVDCSCAAYDGRQVYVAPRALAAYITQTNQIDLTRRSPSYENRLSKYSRRGFEIFWPHLDRSRIDPTIFERSFSRTVGLARLLVLEKLPKSSDRESYLQQRRMERGRPPKLSRTLRSRQLRGNIKDDWDDEVAEWVEQDEASDYHTITIPYGERFHARKIEKLLYTKDLLLNAEWNRPKDREVNLHRHPAFFGNAEDVIYDCCGYCPKPVTPEEKEIAEEESKIYVSGNITFIKDDPGRQAIGSFNPITETDWTEMAYVGNTERLCQAIVACDLEEVKDWFSQEESDPNRRDYTGRTPLHLACMTSTPEIVQCLVDHGARLISRLADGRTALHLAAARGNVDIAKILLTKSAENEEEEIRKEQARREAERKAKRDAQEQRDAHDESGDDELISNASGDSDGDFQSVTTGSFVKIEKRRKNGDTGTDNVPEDANQDEPDVYDINVLAWDNPTSPLHLAILNGHVEMVDELVTSFGADVLLPVKVTMNRPSVILNLVLALKLPFQKARAMTTKLLQLGASLTQADLDQSTPLHYLAASTHSELFDVLLEHDKPSVARTINHLAVTGSFHKSPDVHSALKIAINTGNLMLAVKLLEAGASLSIDFSDFIKSARLRFGEFEHRSSEDNEKIFEENVTQPVVHAVEIDQPLIALELLARGADPNTLTPAGCRVRKQTGKFRHVRGTSLLDLVREKLKSLRQYEGEKLMSSPPEPLDADDNVYLKDFEEGTYRMWSGREALKVTRERYEIERKRHEEKVSEAETSKGVEEKRAAVQALIPDFERLEAALVAKGAKTFKELFPDVQGPPQKDQLQFHQPQPWKSIPFKVSFTFKVPDLTSVKREGYLRLFEAAWCGDLSTIKALTLRMWGPNQDQIPLQIAVADQDGFSPFSIAVLRGHLEVGKAILEIVCAQYQPEESDGRVSFHLSIDDDPSGDEHDDDGIRIGSEIIDEQFTIDNIGEVSAQVKCQITPVKLLSWRFPAYRFEDNRVNKVISSGKASGESISAPSDSLTAAYRAKRNSEECRPYNLVQYAIWRDDVDLLVFLLDLGRKFSSIGTEAESSHMYTVSEADFVLAIKLGHVRCLAELIKRTGAGISLDEIADHSGVERKEAPTYYQGLSVHGKKRADWAAAGGGRRRFRQHKDGHPPLLVAAYEGSLDSVEWFLSTAPERHYSEFTTAYQHDERLKRLAQAKLGVERSMASWLGLRNDLVLHCAVLSRPSDESERLVKYLVENVPSSLETKSAQGYTPLALAYSLHRTNVARILIGAGANQTVRDHEGRNLIHLLLCSVDHRASVTTDDLQDLLDMLDPLLVPSLLTERSQGGQTPIARWIHVANPHLNPRATNTKSETDDKVAVLRLVLDFAAHTGQKHLELLDGAGNTPVHDAVTLQLPRMLELMLERRPDLLYRENATGCTPADLAHDRWVSESTAYPPHIPKDRVDHFAGEGDERKSVLKRQPGSFLSKKDPRSERQIIWDLCRERIGKGGDRRPRRLVSLFEANEVARRLGARQNQIESSQRDQAKDEVSEWYWKAASTSTRPYRGPVMLL